MSRQNTSVRRGRIVFSFRSGSAATWPTISPWRTSMRRDMLAAEHVSEDWIRLARLGSRLWQERCGFEFWREILGYTEAMPVHPEASVWHLHFRFYLCLARL